MQSTAQPILPPIERYIACACIVGEGPVWHPTRSILYWVDIDGKAIHSYDPATQEHRVRPTAGKPTALAFQAHGDMLVGLDDTLVWMNDDGQVTRVVWTPDENTTGWRFNDGKVDPSGRFWIGGITAPQTPTNQLFRYNPDSGSMTVMETGIHGSNGMDWDMVRGIFYYADTETGNVYTYDYDDTSGQISNRRVFVHLAGQYPDGLTLDIDGNVWLAVWGSAVILRFAPDGTPIGSIPVPAQASSSCIFGGDDLRDLFITTAAVGTPEALRAQEPYAGDVFVVRGAGQGRAVHLLRSLP